MGLPGGQSLSHWHWQIWARPGTVVTDQPTGDPAQCALPTGPLLLTACFFLNQSRAGIRKQVIPGGNGNRRPGTSRPAAVSHAPRFPLSSGPGCAQPVPRADPGFQPGVSSPAPALAFPPSYGPTNLIKIEPESQLSSLLGDVAASAKSHLTPAWHGARLRRAC